MIKKVTHIIFALFLMIATSGVTLSMHYCGGNLVSTSINHKAKSCCDGTGGCCESKIIHVQIEDNFVSSIPVESNQTVELDLLFPLLSALNTEILVEDLVVSVEINDTSPPPVQKRLALLQTYLC